MNFIKFAAVFLVGSALYLWKEVVPDSGRIALGCAGAVPLVSLFLPGLNPAFSFAAACLGAPLIVLPLLWLGAHLPFQRVGARNDYSYGVYILRVPGHDPASGVPRGAPGTPAVPPGILPGTLLLAGPKLVARRATGDGTAQGRGQRPVRSKHQGTGWIAIPTDRHGPNRPRQFDQ